MTNAVDSFINAIVEGLIKHEGFNEHIKGVVSNDSFTDDHLDNQIAEWMRYNFDLSDYHFDITDWSHEIDGLIDQQVQYLAEEGDMKEWLGNRDDDSDFRQKVIDVVGDITVGFDIK
jgi:hypothetical protein